jgi:hypothetical protein
MIFLYLFLTLIFGVSIGGYLSKKLAIKALNLEINRQNLEKENQFLEVLSQIKSGKSSFKTRVNDAVYVEVELENLGTIDVIYLMDKNDIALFKEAKCLNTSDGIQKEIITEIIDSIYKKYNQKVNDVVQILGFTFSREEFEKTFRVKAEDLKKVFDPVNIEVTEIEQINIENQKKFDIDDILDKISATGITSLTIEERLFLDNYSNEKGN